MEEIMVELATQSDVRIFKDGRLIAPNYHNRMKIPDDLVARIYNSLRDITDGNHICRIHFLKILMRRLFLSVGAVSQQKSQILKQEALG
jgi:hypothetical protein